MNSSISLTNCFCYLQPEWLIANNGSLFACCIAAGIYATNSPEACHYITQHSKSEVVVVDGNKQLEKYASMAKKDFPFLKALVVYAEEALDQVTSGNCWALHIEMMKRREGTGWIDEEKSDRGALRTNSLT
jgi:long-subunit acyl-CoA synthetase (AMP-forming)